MKDVECKICGERVINPLQKELKKRSYCSIDCENSNNMVLDKIMYYFIAEYFAYLGNYKIFFKKKKNKKN